MGAAVGAVAGMLAGSAGLTVLGLTAGSMWLVGAAVGSLFDNRSPMGFNQNSPTYSLGPLQNTKSQLIPIPIIYGKCRVGGNIIIQDFLDDKKERMNLFVAVSEGEIQSITEVKANDQYPYNLEDCSYDVYLGTSWQQKDSRHPTISSELSAKGYDGRYPNLAYIALTLKAQQKLSGNPTISCIAEGRKVWTPDGVMYSRNPVWCLVDLLSHPRYGLGMWDASNNQPNWDLIDYDAAVYSASYCDEGVGTGPRFTLDYVVDTQKPCLDVLRDILSNFRGYIVARDKLEIHVDRPSTVYKYIDQSDIIEGSFSWEQKSGEEIPNRFVLNWINPNDHYESNAYIIEDIDRISEEGVNQQQYDLLGTTREEQVARMGAYLVDQANGVRDFCSFGLALDNADIEVGDVIGVTHDLPGWGNYDGEHPTIQPKKMRVVRIEDIEEPNGLEYVQVMCSEYIEEIYNDRLGDIPIKIDTGMENPWQCPNVTNLTATEFLQIHPDGTVSSNINISWHDPDVMLSGIEVSVLEEGDSTWKSCGIVSPGIENYVIHNIRWNQTISIRVVAINTNGIKASGVFTSLTLYGKELPPGPPTNLKVSGGAQHIALSWDNPPDVDFSHVDIVEYKGTAHPGYDPSIGTLVASISGNSFTRGGLDDLQTYWYWVRSVDTSGNTSDWVGPMSGVTKTTEIPLITETMIADDAISTPKLQTNAVTSDKIAANSIVASKINVDALSAISADLGTVTAGVAKSADGKLEINLANRTIKVWDDNGVLRVQLGAL
jgi:predicted phage tail protein